MITCRRRRGLVLLVTSMGLLVESCSVYTKDLLASAGEETAPPAGLGAASGGGGPGGDDPAGSSGGQMAAVGGQTAVTGGTDPGSATGGMGLGGAPDVVPDPDPCSAVPPGESLANFEEGTGVLAPVNGRNGSWFLFNDGSGSQLPAKPSSGPLLAQAGGACETNYAFVTTANGFSGWGAGIGVDLVAKVSGEKQPYDLSAYRGMSFFAKADAPLALRVSWSDGNTTDEGGVCDPLAGSGDPDRCGDYFGKDLFVGSAWTIYEVDFDELTQRGFGLAIPGGFDPASAYTLRAQTGGPTFEFSIDEITLLLK